MGTWVRGCVGTLVSGYVGMTTSTTPPASCYMYLRRRTWTRCRSSSTGCREMALLPLRDGELPLESVVTQSSDRAVTAEPRHDPPRMCCAARPVSGPAALSLSLARTCLHGPHSSRSSCVRRVQLQIFVKSTSFLKAQPPLYCQLPRLGCIILYIYID